MYFANADWLVATGNAAVNLGLSVAGSFLIASDVETSDARSLAVQGVPAREGRAVAQLATKARDAPRDARRRRTSRQYQ